MADTIITAACCLHNMLCSNSDFVPENEYLNNSEACLMNLEPVRQNYTQQAIYIRDKYKDYFVSDAGSVPWQIDKVRRGKRNIVNFQ